MNRPPVYVPCDSCLEAAEPGAERAAVRVTLEHQVNPITGQNAWVGACPRCGRPYVDYYGPGDPVQQTMTGDTP